LFGSDLLALLPTTRTEAAGLSFVFTDPVLLPERGAVRDVDAEGLFEVRAPLLATLFSSSTNLFEEGLEAVPERPLLDLGIVLPPAPLPRGP